MNHITIPITPSSEDIQSLRNLFKKYSVEKPGVLSMQEINLLILELVNKPEPFQIQEVILFLFSFSAHSHHCLRLGSMKTLSSSGTFP